MRLMNILGPRLKKRAAELRMKDTEVAIAADVPVRNYGHYAKGRSVPKVDAFLRICRVLETTPNDLLGFPTPTPAPAAEPEMDESRLSRAVHLVLKTVYPSEDPEVMTKIADGLIATYYRLKAADEDAAVEVRQIMSDAPTIVAIRKH